MAAKSRRSSGAACWLPHRDLQRVSETISINRGVNGCRQDAAMMKCLLHQQEIMGALVKADGESVAQTVRRELA
jgi:hypothetical protein